MGAQSGEESGDMKPLWAVDTQQVSSAITWSSTHDAEGENVREGSLFNS